MESIKECCTANKIRCEREIYTSISRKADCKRARAWWSLGLFGEREMKLLKIWEKLGKQPLYITQHTDAKVFIKGLTGEYQITGIHYENGKPLGFDAVSIDCSTCKNNVEFPPPHTCDICTSLDMEGEYGMWEAK